MEDRIPGKTPMNLERQRRLSPHPFFWETDECGEEDHCVRLPWWVLIYSAAIGIILLLTTVGVVYP